MTIGLDSDKNHGSNPGLYEVEEEDPPTASSQGPFVIRIQRQGPSWATLHHTTEGKLGGHFPGYRKRTERQNKGWSSRTRASTPTSTGRELRPSHNTGRLLILASPPPGPTTRNRQVTSIQDTKATNYQEGPIDEGDKHIVQPLTKTAPRAGMIEEKSRKFSQTTRPPATERRSGYWTPYTEEPTVQFRRELAGTGGHLLACGWDMRGASGRSSQPGS